MIGKPKISFIAFDGSQRIALGSLAYVALKVKVAVDEGVPGPVVVLHAATSEPVQLDLRGTPADVLARLSAAAGAVPPPAPVPRGRGRPKLGVVPREITLLPAHWDWLNEQPGGASVTLRKLVDHASRSNAPKDDVRSAVQAATRFMAAVARNLPNFAEATQALAAGQADNFNALVAAWPADVRDHATTLAAAVFNYSVPATTSSPAA